MKRGRKKHTSLDKLKASSTFKLLKELFQSETDEEFADKLLFSNAFRHAKNLEATTKRLSGENCIREDEIINIAEKAERYIGRSGTADKISKYFHEGPDQLFLALSGQQPSYYMDGPKNEFQSFVILIYELQHSNTDSLSFRIARSQLLEALECVKKSHYHLALKWLYQSIIELLESKIDVTEPIPATVEELFRREMNQVFLGNRPDRLFTHLSRDD